MGESDSKDTRLGDLLKARGFAGSAPAPAPEKPATAQPTAGLPDLARIPKIVLRRERKGRGGKTVTMVTGLGLPPAALEVLAKAMRKGLGCGSTVEEGAIILQGDIVPRAQAWLLERGAKKVISG